MVIVAAFHGLMLLLVVGVVSRAIPEKLVSSLLGYLHSTIGITMPRATQVRAITLVWIGCVIFLVDGCLALLVFITASLSSK
jgi:uncharacterized membrane protein